MRFGSFSRRRTTLLLLALTTLVPSGARLASAQSYDVSKLPGIFLDDQAGAKQGEWKSSVSSRPFYEQGYIHDNNEEKGARSVEFTVKVPKSGKYHILFGYTSGSNRDKAVPVSVDSGNGEQFVEIDQRKPGSFGAGLESLGEYELTVDQPAKVIVSNRDTTGHVIVDCLLVVTAEQHGALAAQLKKMPLAQTKAIAKADDKPAAVKPVAPQLKFTKIPPTRPVARLTPDKLDAMLAKEIGPIPDDELLSDDGFLVRASLDLIGRQPTLEEIDAYAADASPNKRSAAIDRLLAMPEYGRNWSNYWIDVIGSRQMEPQLTFHNYDPLHDWLAEKLNTDKTWDEVVFHLLTATGKVGQHPETTYIAFHQGNSHRLAGETSRVFLGVQIACAECHDHPFIDMPTEVFHGMAAWFTRTDAKIAQFDSNLIEVVSKDKGEHKIPGKSGEMPPTTLDGSARELGQGDVDRRQELANWVTAGDNPFFAKAYVNRVWARLLGHGFSEPVDDLGQEADIILPEVLDAVAEHFVAVGYDPKEMLRLILNTRTYQRRIAPLPEGASPLDVVRVKKLRGDEIFDALVTAIELPNFTPERMKKSSTVRFPPPPKSTRDLVNEVFGYDPSLKDDSIVRTMGQAMFMMNNTQLQAQINAQPDSGTFLSRLLTAEQDDRLVAERLFLATLGRKGTAEELKIAIDHVATVKERGPAFEDILWGLVNSAEFTTRR